MEHTPLPPLVSDEKLQGAHEKSDKRINKKNP